MDTSSLFLAADAWRLSLNGESIDLPPSDSGSGVGTDFDRAMMRRCLELALKAKGCTSPNPMVGAVVVRDGKVVGEGFHPKAGEPHAEVFALRSAGELARGATVYVSLEPCNHYGRTPPCSQALVKAGVAKVVVGMVDPNPLVAGGGIKTLRDAGIEVVVGVEEAACRKLNEGFVHRILCQRPLGILKYAMTLDGKIATTTGHSAWVTSPETRKVVHEIRVGCDAVVVGGNTVRKDNPYLTSHQVGKRNPLRVVMSRTLDLPVDAHLWQTEEAATLVLTEPTANSGLRGQLEASGVEVVNLTPLTPGNVMQYFYERGFCNVLWECGGQLAAKAIADGSIQKILAFIAPKIIGGNSHTPTPVGDLGLTQMTQALNLHDITVRAIASDLLIEGYLSPQNNSP
ncbi:riboflavin biosynthesis protein RibD [Calothrix sp. NIES-3974]|nr:riboflavin biosynthesis protein RibD [Calothrix sp. NIES-3974]